MKSSIQLAFVKPIKDGRILFKIRPHLQMRDAWTEVSAVLSAADFAETWRHLLGQSFAVSQRVTSSFEANFLHLFCTQVLKLAVLEGGLGA